MRLRFLSPLFAVWLAMATPVTAQEPGSWRFWTLTDGLRESYTHTLSVDPTGRVWLRHGSVDTMSTLDGYSIMSLAEPRPTEFRSLPLTYGLEGRVYAARDGDLWTIERGILSHYEGHKWVIHPTPAEE